MTEYRLISSDSHVTMPDEAWQEYLDPEFRDRAPRIERTDEGDFRVFEGRRTPIMTLDNLAGKKPEEFSLNVRKLEDQRSGAGDPAARIEDMDTDGVDAEVLYVGGPLASSDPALRLNSVRGYNRWLSDYASYAPGRLLGMAAIPIDTPERAVEEIRFAAAQPGLAGGYIPLFPPEGDYGNEQWNPMWEAFGETGLPIGLHVGGRRPGTPTASIYESAPRFMTGLVMSKLTMAESVSELIHGLVMQRYPELKFIAVEGQIGWISFFLYYSDHLFEKHRFWTKSELDRSRRATTSTGRCSAPSWKTPWVCASASTSGSTTSCGRATTRTPRPPGPTRRPSPTSGSRPSATRRRPRSSGRTAPSSTASPDRFADVHAWQAAVASLGHGLSIKTNGGNHHVTHDHAVGTAHSPRRVRARRHAPAECTHGSRRRRRCSQQRRRHEGRAQRSASATRSADGSSSCTRGGCRA